MTLITQNCQQRTLITLFLLLDAYRVLIGSFYTLFVPQSCPDKPILVFYNTTNTTLLEQPNTFHPCTLEDNVTDLTLLNEAALSLNAATCFFMVIGFILEYRREQWMVKHLEVDPKKSDNNLVTEIESYEKMKKSLKNKNRDFRNIFAFVGVMSAINIICSGFLVYEYYDGFKTTTTFITNTLLILMRVSKSISISQTCEKEMKAQSVYLTEPTTFNTIDPAYKKEEMQMMESPMKDSQKKEGTTV
jgi:hypothetical protein